MKPKQLEVVMGFLKGHDVFGVLPTGFGKSLCFGSLPSIFDQLLSEKDSSIVLLITPLTAIMKDQVNLAILHKFIKCHSNLSELILNCVHVGCHFSK